MPPPHATHASTRTHSNVAMLPVTKQTVQQLQRELQQDGFYHGPIDGVVGPETRDALTAYQREHGLQQTAALDWPTLQQLAQGGGSTSSGSSTGGTPSSGASKENPGTPPAAPSNQPAAPSGNKPPPSGQTQ